MNYLITLVVESTLIRTAAVTLDGIILNAPQAVPIPRDADGEAVLGALIQAIRLTAYRHRHVLHGICIAVPAPFDYGAGIPLDHADGVLGAVRNMALGEELSVQIGIVGTPILFRNTTDAAMIGEARFGAGFNAQRIVGVMLSEQLESALLVAGEIVRRVSDSPAAHFTTASLTARLAAAAPDAIIEDNALADYAAAARNGDFATRSAFAAFGADLATFLAPLAHEFNAGAVLLLGDLTRYADLFLPELHRSLVTEVVVGHLGLYAPILGVADLLLCCESAVNYAKANEEQTIIIDESIAEQ